MTTDEIDIFYPTYDEKVLELISKEFAEHFTGVEIVKILHEHGLTDDVIQYPNTKWVTLKEAFLYLKQKKSGQSISALITRLLHPYNYGLNDEVIDRLVDRIKKCLKFVNLNVEKYGNNYVVMSDEEMASLSDSSEDRMIDEICAEEDKKIIIKNKESIKRLREAHQTYIDIIETFCRDHKNPSDDLNEAYLYLSKKIRDFIPKLRLRYYKIDFYMPFKKDLYSAEHEWNGDGSDFDVKFTPKLSWDAIRPSLYNVHSKITELCNISEENSKLTGDDKRLDQINTMISQRRIIPSKKKMTGELLITHKFLDNKPPTFYITKKGDDFHYKGLPILTTKKNTDYYKVFCALYAKLPDGGEIQYKDLISEIKSRIPDQRDKNDDEMKKFIQRNLTEKYSTIRQDNSLFFLKYKYKWF
jgi:hypothetical protein